MRLNLFYSSLRADHNLSWKNKEQSKPSKYINTKWNACLFIRKWIPKINRVIIRVWRKPGRDLLWGGIPLGGQHNSWDYEWKTWKRAFDLFRKKKQLRVSLFQKSKSLLRISSYLLPKLTPPIWFFLFEKNVISCASKSNFLRLLNLWRY